MYKNIIGIVLSVSVCIFSSCNNSDKSPGATGDSGIKANNAQVAEPAPPPAGFGHKYATVKGVKIHYVVGGTGEPLVLLHGFGQNWYMWNRILPELAKHFTVIAPDLPGLGESGKLEGSYQKKIMASYIHGVVNELGYASINLAGHDIGLMVAYAYAAQFPTEVKKLALLDALLPGVEPVWSATKAQAWWFGFFGWAPSGQIVEGKERQFLTGFWPVVGFVKDPFTKEETEEFIRAYSVPGSTAASFQWFAAFDQDAIDNKEFMKTKLKMPLLAMGGEHFGAKFLEAHCKLVAENVSGSNIAGSGHWIAQENTAQVQKDLLAFFLSK
jgi:pimeloyl-ACP methyl ester carboxylesterase